MKCPCLYSEVAPICRADTEALRVPTPEHLTRFCLSGQHRRCQLFREFLGLLADDPGRWRAADPSGSVGDDQQESRAVSGAMGRKS